MNKLSLMIGLLMAANLLYAMETLKVFKLPSATILNQRLDKQLGLRHFLEKTGLDEQLDGKEISSMGVVVAVESSLDNYDQYLKNSPIRKKTAALMQVLKPRIIENILEDHPEAIKDLREKGFLSK